MNNGMRGSSNLFDQVTVILLAYNQERFVRESLLSALGQECPPITIIASDDGSSDRTFEIMQECVAAYGGRHKVILNQNVPNLGVVKHFNKLIAMAKGELIIPLAGDDVWVPERVVRTVEFWACNGKPSSINLNAMMIDEEGKELRRMLVNPPKELDRADLFAGNGQGILGFCHKEIFEVFGPLSDKARNEDGQIFFRAFLLNGVKTLEDSIHLYRQHDNNLSIGARMRGLDDSRWLEVHNQLLANRLALLEIRLHDVALARVHGYLTVEEEQELQRLLESGIDFHQRLLQSLSGQNSLGKRLASPLGGERKSKERLRLLIAALSRQLYVKIFKDKMTRNI